MSNRQQEATINIDLVPYEMKREGNYWVIKDCAGSILADLKAPERAGWNEYYGGWIGGKFCNIYYDDEAEECAFEHPNVDAVIDWVSDNFERIASIGYETLERLD